MLTVRLGTSNDEGAVRKFYEANNYSIVPTQSAVVFLAEDANQLIGVVRLEAEEGGLVLRGMRVIPERQRQGVGTSLLRSIDHHLGTLPCWCVSFSHLMNFYGQIRFIEIPVESAPLHLQQRVTEYQRRGHQIAM